ncbi:alpha-amylase family glycosyl hydrolase [Butyrivibrio sp. MC2013]|uniref:alpha-amylase family glycosyl hydrolase n=1 Tax=Butyrivibrio sp. MC2013 TaxID=1280686 RepID=UPI0003FD6FF8|nr:alpha-amylase family glycosyl hydrolase [Butyrivibrio sp. MC2013]
MIGNIREADKRSRKSIISDRVTKRLAAAMIPAICTAALMGCASKAAQPLNVIDDKYRTCYEVFVYSFYDSDGDGIGDLNGLTEKLDYINDGNDKTDDDLGCNEIWLMPISPSPTYHKYDVTDYKDIDSAYGSIEDFDRFIDEAHKRGINVIIDFVMNHSSSEHPWFKEAASYLRMLPEGEEPDLSECPYVDYYHFTREKSDGYERLPATKWYYEARFWKGMPDLNLKSDKVRAEFDDITSFWLDHKVDGFRLDAVTSYETGRSEDIIEELSWFNDMVKSKSSDAYIVGEAWTGRKDYAPFYSSGADSFFDFSFGGSDGNIAKVLRGQGTADDFVQAQINAETLYQSYNPDYINAPFYTNHDMPRSSGYYIGDNAVAMTKMAEAMNLLMQGNAFIYYGEELGMRGAGKDENKRGPMPWSADESAEGTCSGPFGMDKQENAVQSLEEQKADPDSIYNFVKHIIRMRNANPAIARGMTERLTDDAGNSLCTESISAIKRSWEDDTVAIILNISDTEDSIKIPSGYKLADSACASDGSAEAASKGGVLSLPAYSVAILTAGK